MTIAAIRSALEAALAGMSPAIDTVWENDPAYTPVPGAPYQRAALGFLPPRDDESGAAFRQEGFLELNLHYPAGSGVSDATDRVDLIRATFARSSSFNAAGVVTLIHRTPEVIQGMASGDRYIVPIKIPFVAQ